MFKIHSFNSIFVVQVFNAGKNKLRSMEEVSSVISLRALILNGIWFCYFFIVALTMLTVLHIFFLVDNKISSICKLDKLQYLNTLGTAIWTLSLKTFYRYYVWRALQYELSSYMFSLIPFLLAFVYTVLSKNPIYEIGDSLMKAKSLTKVSVC